MFLKKNCVKNVNIGVSEQRDMRVLEMCFLMVGRSKRHMSPQNFKKLWDAPQLIYMNCSRCPRFWKKTRVKIVDEQN
jgi:hypothetical protein